MLATSKEPRLDGQYVNPLVHEMSHCLKCPLSYVDWGHGEHMANSTFSDLSRVSVMCS